jgi:hypothetical protein
VNKTDVKQIEELIETAYVEGVVETQEMATVKEGFHEKFHLWVRDNDSLRVVHLSEWLGRIEDLKKRDPRRWARATSHTCDFIDVSGDAAAVKVRIFKGEEWFSTDYFLLYRFADGWRIVSKVFDLCLPEAKTE